MSRVVKTKELNGKVLLKKDELSTLRGTVVILNSEESEIARHLQIKERGIYGLRFK